MEFSEVLDLLAEDAASDTMERAHVTLACETFDLLEKHRHWLRGAEPALAFVAAPWRKPKRLPHTDVVVLVSDREARQAIDWVARLRLSANFALLYVAPLDECSAFSTIDPTRADFATDDAPRFELSIRLKRLIPAQRRSLGVIDARMCCEGPYTLIVDERALYLEGRRLLLPEPQFRIALELFAARCETVQRERLIRHVRGNNPLAALAVHMSQLRRRLRLAEHGYAILAVPKQGYRLFPKQMLDEA